ncbi:MAG: hypothetical protein QM658_05300 [Gordonia sp. (in: high G+C Gram-positive bacteria)]
MSDLPPITDVEMQTITEYAQSYTVVIVRRGANHDGPDAASLRTEHTRRMYALRAAGQLAVVLAVRDDSPVEGIAIFDCVPETVASVMADDPAVIAGVLDYDIHQAQGFPNDSLRPR